jgi:hypothetical protein
MTPKLGSADTSPLAQALVAGLLQGLGERYGDDAMKAAGEQLAKQAVSDKTIKPPSKP